MITILSLVYLKASKTTSVKFVLYLMYKYIYIDAGQIGALE